MFPHENISKPTGVFNQQMLRSMYLVHFVFFCIRNCLHWWISSVQICLECQNVQVESFDFSHNSTAALFIYTCGIHVVSTRVKQAVSKLSWTIWRLLGQFHSCQISQKCFLLMFYSLRSTCHQIECGTLIPPKMFSLSAVWYLCVTQMHF